MAASVARAPRVATTAAPCAVWVAVVVAGHLLGARLVDADPLMHVGAPPLVGDFDLRLSPRLAPPVALAAVAVAGAPALAARIGWRALLAATWALAAAWAVALAAADGLGAIVAPLETRYEYLADVPRVGPVGEFLRTFTTDAFDYRTHVRGHPPGLLLALTGLDRAGLGGGVVASVLVLAAGAGTAPAALVALRELGGEPAARRAAPFLALAPAAVWIATSADALFAGVAAAGVALFVLATGAAGRRAGVLGAAAGLLLGAALHLTYGAAALAPILLAVALARRRARVLLFAAGGIGAVAAAFLLAGFWWVDGVQATRELYESGIAMRRPYADFLVVNLAAFALALGPAVGAGLARLHGPGPWALSGGALLAVAAVDLSGLSRGETERIWLLLAPWLLVATAALARRPRAWLAAQAALTLALQAGMRSPW